MIPVVFEDKKKNKPTDEKAAININKNNPEVKQENNPVRFKTETPLNNNNMFSMGDNKNIPQERNYPIEMHKNETTKHDRNVNTRPELSSNDLKKQPLNMHIAPQEINKLEGHRKQIPINSQEIKKSEDNIKEIPIAQRKINQQDQACQT